MGPEKQLFGTENREALPAGIDALWDGGGGGGGVRRGLI